ncbi:hypothetical protein [Cellulomonas cellasea]|uniref:Uncharacterized protein n=1 Tax=Cellulomonas cellasea TaxID=43670 RepID=A0A7W4YD73_9CELL|nr:hypothetical protein [Cellulomonas cellasea]MBB2924939.1 hypothetical protein [Cellulomonas cellasea]
MGLSSRMAGLSRGMRAFLLVDLVLVLALVVVAAVVLSGALRSTGPRDTGSDVDPAPSASLSGQASTPTPTATGAGLASFTTQLRNIACTMSDEGVTCTIADKTFVPPGAEACTGTIGHVVVAGAEGVDTPCVDGPAPAKAAPDVPVLEYGSTSTVGGWTCTSATNGVTCVEDASGTGFRLARAELVAIG